MPLRNHVSIRTRVLVIVVALTASTAHSQVSTTKIVGATNALVATLSQPQRDSMLYAFDDKVQRTKWSNLPTGIVQRAGLKLGDLNEVQRERVMQLLSLAFSQRGLEKVQQIMEGDEVLKASGSGRGGPPGGGPPGGLGLGGRGGALLFGKDLYYISILGTPSATTPWMLQFGGHHLAINLTIAGERGILTPTLTGAQPALYQIDGKTIRPLDHESDKGLALLTSLDDTQRKQAIIGARVADLVLGPGQDDRRIQPEGLKASAMIGRQRAMLLDLITEWSGIVHESAAALRMAELRADLNDTWFAWSGPTSADAGRNIGAYYRIQGPRLVIEYAPQQMGGDRSMHVHTMYRDPTNDYAKGVTGK